MSPDILLAMFPVAHQEHGLALALTLDVPQPLPETHDSYCVVISE